MGTAGAHHQAGPAQPRHHLLQVGERKTLGIGDRLEAGRMLGLLMTELDHQPDAVLGFGGEDHVSLNPTRGVGLGSPPRVAL